MSIESETANISKKLDLLTKGLKKEIQENRNLKKRASKFVINEMRAKAPTAKFEIIRKDKNIKPGALKRSIQFLPLRKSFDVFIGPRAKIAPHAHLVEYGYVHWKDKKFKQGTPFVKQTYEQTKGQILKNLIAEATKEFNKQGEILQI